MQAATEDFAEWQAITLSGKIAVFLLFKAHRVEQQPEVSKGLSAKSYEPRTVSSA